MSLKNLSVRKKIPKIYKSKLLNSKVNKLFKKIIVLKNYYISDIGHEDGLLFSKVYFDDYKLS